MKPHTKNNKKQTPIGSIWGKVDVALQTFWTKPQQSSGDFVVPQWAPVLLRLAHTQAPNGHLACDSACSTYGQNICLKAVHLACSLAACLLTSASLETYKWKTSWEIGALYFSYKNGCCWFSEIPLKGESYSWVLVQQANFSLGCNVLKMIWLTWYHNSVSKYVITVRNRKQFLVEIYVQHSNCIWQSTQMFV